MANKSNLSIQVPSTLQPNPLYVSQTICKLSVSTVKLAEHVWDDTLTVNDNRWCTNSRNIMSVHVRAWSVLRDLQCLCQSCYVWQAVLLGTSSTRWCSSRTSHSAVTWCCSDSRSCHRGPCHKCHCVHCTDNWQHTRTRTRTHTAH